MPNRIARPGQLTCVDEACAQAGLRAVEGHTACAVCASTLERVPDDLPARFTAGPAPVQRRATPVPTPAPVPAAGAWADRPLGFRVAAALGVAAAFMFVLYLINNWDAINGAEFKVGDCVTVSTGVLNSDMDKAECAGSSRHTDVQDQVYRVESVVDGKDGTCGGGFNRITFSNEPEDTTYCLVMTR